MSRASVLLVLGAAILGLCECASSTTGREASRSAAAEGDSPYALTQHSASQPSRGSGGPTVAPVLAMGRCDVESCDGNLSPAAVAELRVTASKARDCYERELKENNQLQGKMIVRLRLALGRAPCEIHIEQNTLAASESFAPCVIERLRETSARPDSGCVDLALPLTFVRQEVDTPPDNGASPAPPPAR
jgi:hypothetical protein